MKNLTKLLFLILVVNISTSCSNGDIQEEYTKLNAIELINSFNIDKQDFEEAEYNEGEVFMRTSDDNRIIVFVPTGKKSTTIYQLQQSSLTERIFETTIHNAQVLFFHDNLIINSTTSNEKYLLGINTENSQVNLSGAFVTFNGYGLSRFVLNSDPNVNLRAENEYGRGGDPPPAEGCVCNQNNEAGECDSGGSGSSSCSGAYGPGATQCSVNCDDGYYACCSS